MRRKFAHYCLEMDIISLINQNLAEKNTKQMDSTIQLEHNLNEIVEKIKDFCVSAKKKYNMISKGICRII